MRVDRNLALNVCKFDFSHIQLPGTRPKPKYSNLRSISTSTSISKSTSKSTSCHITSHHIVPYVIKCRVMSYTHPIHTSVNHYTGINTICRSCTFKSCDHPIRIHNIHIHITSSASICGRFGQLAGGSRPPSFHCHRSTRHTCMLRSVHHRTLCIMYILGIDEA